MKTFLYENSFDGLLTALYYALADGTLENRVVSKEHYQPDLFSQPVTIATDFHISQKLYEGIPRRISGQTLRNIYHLYLSEILETGQWSYLYLRKGFQIGPAVNQHITDPEIHQVLKKCRQVLREYHRMTGLLRFQSLKNKVLYAPYHPDFHLTPLLAGHFSRRFSSHPWIIHDINREQAAFWDTKKWVLHPLSPKETLPLSGDEVHFQQLWKAYFQQIAIKERLNLPLQQQFVPQKHRRYLTEFTE
ncbi:TIGR03915 family putative DNA repair protein [Tindallia californiensis]|uniref:Probable DNA metabolism protein n=1 Tax=Tindallia californiensis TaxID=159292 RepID=A0A1H3LJ45_9FIRM|nr:TIGR03915 family putative DNA repair protein [Tindallia californiensis]SDY64159.1 probable DNA metabolism protein [Tindallia californiensis]